MAAAHDASAAHEARSQNQLTPPHLVPPPSTSGACMVRWAETDCSPLALSPRPEPKARRRAHAPDFCFNCFRASCCLGTALLTITMASFAAMPLFFEGPFAAGTPPPSPPAPPGAPPTIFTAEDADAARGMGKILAAQTVLALAAFGATRLVQWRRSLHSHLEPSSLEEPIYGGKRRRGRRKKEAQVEGGGSF